MVGRWQVCAESIDEEEAVTDSLTTLRLQHDEISATLLELHNQVAHYRNPGDAPGIVRNLSRLTRVLRAHLALEDEWLYPAMIGSQEPCASQMAEDFAGEMGGLAAELEQFMLRWAVSAMIATSFEDFRRETFAMLAVIDRRIDREDDQLFPAARTLGLGRPASAA